MAQKKRPEPRTLVQSVCGRCAKPSGDGTTPNYFGTTVPLSKWDAGISCDNCGGDLTEVGRTKEG